MDKIIDMAQDLGKGISNSECYQTYLRYKKQVEKKPALMNKITELRHLQLELQLRRQSDQIVSMEEERRLGDLYSEVTLDEDGSGLWQYEGKVLKILQDTFETISGFVPIDLG